MKKQSKQRGVQLITNLPDVQITDKRDIAELKRREKKGACQPYRNELYSVNPNFNGNYKR